MYHERAQAVTTWREVEAIHISKGHQREFIGCQGHVCQEFWHTETAKRLQAQMRERRRDYVNSLLEMSRNAAAVIASLEAELEELKNVQGDCCACCQRNNTH